MKNKNLVFVGAAILVVILAIGGFFLISSRGEKTATEAAEEQQEAQIKEIQADEIGLTLELLPNKKAVKMDITKLDGIESIEYEGSYDAVTEDEESGEELTLPRGVGPSKIEVEDGGTIARTIELGTCSRNVCKYDNVTSDIKFVIKVNYANGEVGQVEQNIEY
jgi:hypothetical protein